VELKTVMDASRTLGHGLNVMVLMIERRFAHWTAR
jgi:hypothetical protein